MAISTGKKQGMFTEINITPLTDIFLVLLIIMMVIAPTFQNIDQSIEIPEINSGISVEQKETIVSIARNGALYVNKTRASIETLGEELRKAKLATKENAVIVQADKLARNKDVLAVMQEAQAAGYEKLTISGEPLSKVKQRQLRNQADEQTSE